MVFKATICRCIRGKWSEDAYCVTLDYADKSHVYGTAQRGKLKIETKEHTFRGDLWIFRSKSLNKTNKTIFNFFLFPTQFEVCDEKIDFFKKNTVFLFFFYNFRCKSIL